MAGRWFVPLTRTITCAAVCGIVFSGCSKEAETRLPPEIRPTPIGMSTKFRLPALSPSTTRARPVGAIHCKRTSPLFTSKRVHLELFAHNKTLLIPRGVGVVEPTVHQSRIVKARCAYPLRTIDATGVVFTEPGDWTLGDIFAVWGQPLTENSLTTSFTDPQEILLVFVNGKKMDVSNIRMIPLVNGDEIVVEFNSNIPPHQSYTFPEFDAQVN